PRSRAAEPEEQSEDPRHLLAALAGAAQPDRHLDRQAGRRRRQHDPGAWPRLPRRHAAARHQARSLRVHAARPAASRGFRDGVSMGRTMRVLLILAAAFPSVSFAQNFTGYKTTTLDAVIEDWNEKTKDLGPGISLSPPAKVKFIATMSGAPVRCSNAALEM